MNMDSNRLPEGPLPRWLADRYMSMVRRHAYRLARRLPSHVNVEDLVGAGFVGLADALNKYDRSGPDRFEAYADCRIRGAMLDELRSYDPLSRDLRDLNNRIVAAVRKLTAELGRPPEESEIADELRIPVVTFRERLAKLSFGGLVSLDTTGGDGLDGFEVGDENGELADAHLLRSERRDRLASGVQQLPERLQSLLQLYYEQDYTLREIGEILGVTESRACQLHAEAIVRLRAACASEDEPEFVTEVRRLRAVEEEQSPDSKSVARSIRRAG
ncbi:MAG TPA: FliA/WhiG family RNA polymerase sigma factor [Polyangiaceae bacterium]|nr:FliA/WhiG family RNA polymerase sigma factor [Polyangiaceae bacterium]